MAYAANITTSAPQALLRGMSFAALKVKFDQYMVFRKTVSELSTLSSRELADLGLSRSAIKGIAYEVAYGK